MCRATLLCCLKCTTWFGKTNSCQVCGDWKCPHCGSCLCDLTLSEKKIAVAYMATYENLLRELTGESYDFRRHQQVLREIRVSASDLVKSGRSP